MNWSFTNENETLYQVKKRKNCKRDMGAYTKQISIMQQIFYYVAEGNQSN